MHTKSAKIARAMVTLWVIVGVQVSTRFGEFIGLFDMEPLANSTGLNE